MVDGPSQADSQSQEAPSATDDARFPKSLRLLTSTDFDRVYSQRNSASDGLLLVHGCRNDLETPRLGLTVSRRVGNAPIRNRWKRLIREAFRQSQGELPGGIDLVVAPRRGAAPQFADLKRSLVRLARRVERKAKH